MDNSPTDSGSDQSSSGSPSEPLLEPIETPSAEEQPDTASGGDTQEAGQPTNQPQDEPTGSGDSSSDDDGLAKFAKSQGVDDLGSLSERELKLLKIARDNQKAFREKPASDELRKAVSENFDPNAVEDDGDEVMTRLQRQDLVIAQLSADRAVDAFWIDNPEAREFEADMAKVLLDEKEQFGVDAARILAQNMPRLYREARARRGDNDTETAREAGRREERESLRHKQQAGADNASASQPGPSLPKRVTRDWINKNYDPSNPEHIKLLDDAMAEGRIV